MQEAAGRFQARSCWHMATVPLRAAAPAPGKPTEESVELVTTAAFVPVTVRKKACWSDSGRYMLAAIVQKVGEHDRLDVVTYELYLGQPQDKAKAARMGGQELENGMVISCVDCLVGPWVLLCAALSCVGCSSLRLVAQ
jgi:hypothetical protein